MTRARSVLRHHTWGDIPAWIILWQVERTRHPTPATGPDGVGPERTEWLQLAIICAASFVVWAGFGAILPYLPVFLQEEAEAPVWLIGVVAAAYYVGSFAFSAVFGRLSDRSAASRSSLPGWAFMPWPPFSSSPPPIPGWFIFFRFLEGMGAAAVTPAGQALVAELSTESRAVAPTAG